jgi:hypothetical protein
MLFFMGAASHLSVAEPASAGQCWAAFILLLVVMAVIEINAVLGPATPDKASGGKKLLATLNGTFWAGFVVTAVLYIGMELIF